MTHYPSNWWMWMIITTEKKKYSFLWKPDKIRCWQYGTGSDMVLLGDGGIAAEFRVWCQRSSCRCRCSWTMCWGFQSHCLLLETCAHILRISVRFNSHNYTFVYRTLQLGGFVWIPELVRDWQDLDFPMSEMRLAAAIQPSLEVLRLRTSLHETHTHTKVLLEHCCYNIFHFFQVELRLFSHHCPSSPCLTSCTMSPLFTESSWAPPFS